MAIESGNEVSSSLVNHLKNDEDERRQLDDLVQEFCELAASEEVKFRIICFYETRRSDFSKILDKLPRNFVAAQVNTGTEGIVSFQSNRMNLIVPLLTLEAGTEAFSMS